MDYAEEDFLQLSGIQHFCYCRRQWALIHIERQWHENLLTAEGRIVHERCHDETIVEKRSDCLVTRGLRILSRRLGITGQCDVVEFFKTEEPSGCALRGHRGLWMAYPVEYKHGKSKSHDADRLQLCAQAICLEEMLGCAVGNGALYYAETHRREEVVFTQGLRQTVENMLKEMHDYFSRGYTPKVKTKTGCRSCSLKEVCLPVLCKKRDVSDYYAGFLESSQ